jgi:predicted phosphodiesterase
MRCLFVADLHYSLPQFDWLLRSAAGYDLVVLAGDALDVGSIAIGHRRWLSANIFNVSRA